MQHDPEKRARRIAFAYLDAPEHSDEEALLEQALEACADAAGLDYLGLVERMKRTLVANEPGTPNLPAGPVSAFLLWESGTWEQPTYLIGREATASEIAEAIVNKVADSHLVLVAGVAPDPDAAEDPAWEEEATELPLPPID